MGSCGPNLQLDVVWFCFRTTAYFCWIAVCRDVTHRCLWLLSRCRLHIFKQWQVQNSPTTNISTENNLCCTPSHLAGARLGWRWLSQRFRVIKSCFCCRPAERSPGNMGPCRHRRWVHTGETRGSHLTPVPFGAGKVGAGRGVGVGSERWGSRAVLPLCRGLNSVEQPWVPAGWSLPSKARTLIFL